MEQEEIKRLYTSRKNVLNILGMRGYDTTNNDMSFEEFKQWVGEDEESEVREAMEMSLEKKLDPDNKILVIWMTRPKVDTALRDIICKKMEYDENYEYKRAFVIADEGATPWAKTQIQNLRKIKKIYIDVYVFSRTLIDIMQHRLVPKFRICSPHEKRIIMKMYGLNAAKIPWIRLSDPVVHILGAEQGQLLEIERESESGKYITYRLVVV